MSEAIERELASRGITGLTAEAVAARVREGATNAVSARTSRSYPDILRANVFTWFNLVLGVLWLFMVSFGSIKDALFGFVLVFNTAVGIVQEVRAKLTLDRLSLLTAPKARVWRAGELSEVAVGDVVLGDVVVVESGDQVVADGTLVWSDGLEIDESLLTGESAAVSKGSDGAVLSGTFAVAGRGAFAATAVGRDARAQRIAAQGRKYVRAHSDVMAGINTILKVVGVVMVPVAALTVLVAIRQPLTVSERVTAIVATLVAMVPEGLVLLSSISFAVSAVVLARRGVLVNELSAVEGLARADVVCADKTGTLTEPQPAFSRFELVGGAGIGEPDALAALGALAAASPTANATVTALRDALPAPAGWQATSTAPFSSARKWSAASFDAHGTWVLGAPEVLLADSVGVYDPLRSRARELAGAGPRVLLLSWANGPADAGRLPDGMTPVGFVLLAEKLRPDAAETVRYLGEQGVIIKVISGDAPDTVSAIASQVGVPGAQRAVDARTLPEGDALGDVMERETVFGRVMPEQKSAMVAALQARGHSVAMTGDGVNDVLAVKTADLGIAMGSGAAATRAVAGIVLLDGRFSRLPSVLAEGRRVIANAERVANLFVTKTVWATVLALVFGLLALPYPFMPRQITLVGSLTIGIPAFFLALAPNVRLYRPGFVRRVARYAFSSGALVALTVLATYWLERSIHEPASAVSTACTIALSVVGFGVIASLERPLRGWRLGMFAALAALMVLALAIPFARDFFALELLALRPLAYALACGGSGFLGVWALTRPSS